MKKFTQSRADRDAELAAHDQLSREAVELRAEVKRWEDWSNSLTERIPEEYDCDDAQEAIIERWIDDRVAEIAGLRGRIGDLVDAAEEEPTFVDNWFGRPAHVALVEADDLRAALAAEPAEVTPPAEQQP